MNLLPITSKFSTPSTERRGKGSAALTPWNNLRHRAAALKRWWLIVLLLMPAAAWPVTCTMSAGNVNFGNYTGTASTVGGSPLSVNCSAGTGYQVLLNAGQGAGGSTTIRKMTSGASTLSYGLYQDAAHTRNWGNSTGTGYVPGTGAQNFTVYPLLSSGQTVPPGTYTDTITASLGGASGTTTFTVTATVAASCTISVDAIAFGVYTGVAKQASTTVHVNCTQNTNYTIGLDQGISHGATVTTRTMTASSGSVLPYAIYSDSARTVNWGNTVGTDTVAGTGTGAAQAISAYGRVGATTVNPGSYADTVTATLSY